MDMPMLLESEWEEIRPLLYPETDEKAALQTIEKITGMQETNINAIWHHRASTFGPPCGNCGKPLRTPKAKFCSECGLSKSQG